MNGKNPMITQVLIDEIFSAFMAKDLEAVLVHFAADAVVFDPHYPIAEMIGIASIRRGFGWGLGNMEQPGFQVRRFWSQGQSGAVEVDTHHVFKGGMQVRFSQVFVFETAEGKVVSLRAYVPYPPPGIASWLAGLTRLVWRLKGYS
jgi:ketosteroid isomerase-like protein